MFTFNGFIQNNLQVESKQIGEDTESKVAWEEMLCQTEVTEGRMTQT